jgi:Met-zincin/Domain of unknown function (DUF5117)
MHERALSGCGDKCRCGRDPGVAKWGIAMRDAPERVRSRGQCCPVAVACLCSWFSAGSAQSLHSERPAPKKAGVDTAAAVAPKSFSAMVAGLERREGLLPVYLDRKGGRVLIALKASGRDGELGEYLYQVYMRSGLGSTPVGLDRSAPAATRIIVFRRGGTMVFAELQNTAFRAEQGSEAEKAAVHDSFAPSIIWSSSVLAEEPDGTVLIDLSGFLARDAYGVIDALSEAKQGKFALDPRLSYPDVAATEVFPENLEFEAHQTFTSDDPGPEVKAIVPQPHAVTLVEHQSLIKLPAPGFQPRLADPRTGAITSLIADYSAPLDAPVVTRMAHRFRLEKTDPAAARSPVKKPIIFYVDRAAPEPVRSALLQGASWWAAAFDAAGFVDAFRVDLLPAGVNPLDARYNVINWVHRQTRGWSYGENIIDPRTGEIVKGTVLLGSLRMRQDQMIFEGLVGADKTGSGAQDDPIRISLARLRQLAVHETGHAIGLEHNFAGSTYDDRASVMDYPSPRISIVNGALDFSDAYKVGIGSWDRFAIHWLYDEAPAGQDQRAALDAIVKDAYAHGQRFVTDDDARSPGSAQPYGALWDDGPDAVSELAHVLEVRRLALQRFGLGNLPPGAPLADLRRVVVPVYLFHRYEVDAASKSIGGWNFSYAVKGDGMSASAPVPGSDQRRALSALLNTLDPKVLDLPDALINLLSAGNFSEPDKQSDIELFGAERAPPFDLQLAASLAADITLGDLLRTARLNRVAEQGMLDPQQLSLPELLSQTIATVFAADGKGGAHGAALRRSVQARLMAHLANAKQDKSLSPAAAADLQAALAQLGKRLEGLKSADAQELAAAHYYADVINHDKLKEFAEQQKGGPAVPPGMPIGGNGEDDWFSDAGG